MDRFWADAVDRLTFAFQPLVSCRDESLVALEALLRGHRDAGFGTIQDVFDAAAADFQLVEVETALREKALRLFSLLGVPSEVKLFSNVDNRVFSQPGWRKGTMAAVLERTGLSADRLVLEISERFPYFPEDGEGEGVDFALDDFGTGYAGLQTLVRAKPTYVKIDRFFVQGVSTDAHKQNVYQGMVDLGHRIGALVIAEGAETADELAYCLGSGADWVQGFAVGRPTFAGDSLPLRNSRRQGLLFTSSRL